jgi:hypothetical protein
MDKQSAEVQLYAFDILALDGEDPAWSTSLAQGRPYVGGCNPSWPNRPDGPQLTEGAAFTDAPLVSTFVHP